jgi:hypothetical protein
MALAAAPEASDLPNPRRERREEGIEEFTIPII